MSKPTAPKTLGTTGRGVWNRITSKYELRADELYLLEDACATSDIIAELSEAWAKLGRPLTTKGSMGQQVIHPLIGEIRAQRAARNTMWRQLKLPDDLVETGGPKVNPQREGGQARWANAHGA